MSVTAVIFVTNVSFCFYVIHYVPLRPFLLEYHLDWIISSADVINEYFSVSCPVDAWTFSFEI